MALLVITKTRIIKCLNITELATVLIENMARGFFALWGMDCFCMRLGSPRFFQKEQAA